MKINKKTIFIISILTIFFLIIGFISYNNNKNKKINFSQEIISRVSYQDDIKKSILSNSGEINVFLEKNKKKLDEISSLSRSICIAYYSYDLAINSRYFKELKNYVDILKKISGKNKDEFTYIYLPSLFYESCNTRDFQYKEKLLMYLQSDEKNIDLKLQKVLKEELYNYISKISFNYSELDKNKLKNDKKYFDDFFFNKNNKNLISIYYPFYVKERRNLLNFLNKPANDLDEEIEFKEKIMTSLLLNLKILGFNNIEEFKNLILKNYNISDIEEYKKNIIKKYIDFEEKVKYNGIDLQEKLKTNENFKRFILSGEYKKIITNKELSNQLNSIGKDMSILTIISNDYADSMNETWSGKRFFGDEQNGNALIRLNFIYILSLK